MKALILGARGQLGRALAATAPEGVDVVALGRSDCDIGQRDALRSCIERERPDLLFNAAAYTAVDLAETEVEAARLLNGIAPGWIAQCARAAGSRFIHISTDFVFTGDLPRPLAPSDPVGPASVYGRTKLEGETAVAAADPDALIVRTAWVYAAEGVNFLNTMLRAMREKQVVSVVSDQIGTPTHARSLARMLWRLADINASGILHSTDSGVASWYDFAVAIQEDATAAGLLGPGVTVLPIRTADFPRPAPRPAYSVLDKTETWRLIGAPAPHWRTELRACLQEYRPHG